MTDDDETGGVRLDRTADDKAEGVRLDRTTDDETEGVRLDVPVTTAEVGGIVTFAWTSKNMPAIGWSRDDA